MGKHALKIDRFERDLECKLLKRMRIGSRCLFFDSAIWWGTLFSARNLFDLVLLIKKLSNHSEKQI